VDHHGCTTRDSCDPRACLGPACRDHLLVTDARLPTRDGRRAGVWGKGPHDQAMPGNPAGRGGNPARCLVCSRAALTGLRTAGLPGVGRAELAPHLKTPWGDGDRAEGGAPFAALSGGARGDLMEQCDLPTVDPSRTSPHLHQARAGAVFLPAQCLPPTFTSAPAVHATPAPGAAPGPSGAARPGVPALRASASRFPVVIKDTTGYSG